MDINIITPASNQLNFCDLAARIISRLLRDKPWSERLRDSLFHVKGVCITQQSLSVTVGRVSDTFGEHGINEEDLMVLRVYCSVRQVGVNVFFLYPKKQQGIEVHSAAQLRLQIQLQSQRASWSDYEYKLVLGILSDLVPEKPDERMSAVELEYKYLERNGGYHPTFQVEHWQGAVAGNFTRSGYWEWVEEQFRMFDETMQPLTAPANKE